MKGIIVPIVTIVDENENFDEKAMREHVDFVIESGVDAILAFGSNGEFYMFDSNEMEDILEVIIDQAAGRVPVMMGIGAIRTRKCVELAKMAEKKGASAISVLPPMFIHPTDSELEAHFTTIANSTRLPMYLYNNPGRVGYGLSQNLVERLAHKVPSIIGMKDTSGNLTQTEEFIRRNADIGFNVFCGRDSLIYPTLVMGGAGAICTTANFLPSLVVHMYDCFEKGDLDAAKADQFRLNPIREEMDNTPFPVATKDYGNLLGLKLGNSILPSVNASGEKRERQRCVLKDAGYLE